jgi:hypothetical protein
MHDELCERAIRWLGGTRRCNPVFSRCASCAEIPDAIGWSSCHLWRGSTVVECKTSASDFYADKKKRIRYKDKFGLLPAWISKKQAQAHEGFEIVEQTMMGDFRFYFCFPGVISAKMVAEHAPDHGLVYKDGRAVRIIIPAPRRTLVDRESEIWFLRFAIINGKQSGVTEKPPKIPLTSECELIRGANLS